MKYASFRKRVYISTPLKEEKFNLAQIQAQIIKEPVFAFIPPTDRRNSKATGALIDRLMLDQCDELWLFGTFGRDCSWEVGYAQALGIKIVIFRSAANKHILDDDWMMFSPEEKPEIRDV